MTDEEILKAFRAAAESQPYGAQSQIAKKMAVSRSYISHLLKGRSPLIPDHVYQLASALDLELVVQPKGTKL